MHWPTKRTILSWGAAFIAIAILDAIAYAFIGPIGGATLFLIAFPVYRARDWITGDMARDNAKRAKKQNREAEEEIERLARQRWNQ